MMGGDITEPVAHHCLHTFVWGVKWQRQVDYATG